jgi:hypothetical protein
MSWPPVEISLRSLGSGPGNAVTKQCDVESLPAGSRVWLPCAGLDDPSRTQLLAALGQAYPRDFLDTLVFHVYAEDRPGVAVVASALKQTGRPAAVYFLPDQTGRECRMWLRSLLSFKELIADHPLTAWTSGLTARPTLAAGLITPKPLNKTSR